MAYETVWAVRSQTIDQNAWYDIASPPIGCNVIVIMNNTGQTIFLRSDPANANSQVPIYNGQQFTIGMAVGHIGATSDEPAVAYRVRFPAGSKNPAGALQAASSSVSPLIEYMV